MDDIRAGSEKDAATDNCGSSMEFSQSVTVVQYMLTSKDMSQGSPPSSEPSTSPEGHPPFQFSPVTVPEPPLRPVRNINNKSNNWIIVTSSFKSKKKRKDRTKISRNVKVSVIIFSSNILFFFIGKKISSCLGN
jgi:hypothetical protein